jgi:hypothetical protein
MIISSVIFLGCGLVGAYLGGAVGTVWGAAFATWAGALVWWWQLLAAMRESGKVPMRSGLLFSHQAGRHREPTRSRHKRRDAGLGRHTHQPLHTHQPQPLRPRQSEPT